MRVDFHSHILPGMDDGAKNSEMSLAMLEKEKEDGVDTFVLTPHYYMHNESVKPFLKRREHCLKRLREAAEKSGADIPKLVTAAEVSFTPSLINADVSKLCILDTDYLLLELPFKPFSTSLVNSVANFVNAVQVKVILAHIERYYPVAGMAGIQNMLSLDVLAQVNCGAMRSAIGKSAAIKLIERGQAQVIGSDCHNTVIRKPNMSFGTKQIEKKLGKKALERIDSASEMILSNADIDEIFSKQLW